MQWRVDVKEKGLELGGHYWISFDSLTDAESEESHDSWFVHLAKKDWVDMPALLLAFVAAYDAAGLKLDRDFFDRYKKAFFACAEDQYVIAINTVWNNKCNGSSFLETLSDLNNWIFRPTEICIDDLVSDVESSANADI
jgi:hypothetical protein